MQLQTHAFWVLVGRLAFCAVLGGTVSSCNDGGDASKAVEETPRPAPQPTPVVPVEAPLPQQPAEPIEEKPPAGASDAERAVFEATHPPRHPTSAAKIAEAIRVSEPEKTVEEQLPSPRVPPLKLKKNLTGPK
jgi:hypothetical protein